MGRFEESVTINRPPDEVWAVLTDVEKTAIWSAPAVEEHWTTPGPVVIGSRRVATAQMMRRRTQNEAEVTELEPNRRWALKSVSGPPFEVSAMFHAVESGTRVDWTWSFGFSGLLKVVEPMVVAAFERQFAKDLQRLKLLMETGKL